MYQRIEVSTESLITVTGAYVSAEADVVSQDYRLDIMYHRAKLAAEAGKIAVAIELGNKIIEIDINYKDIAQLVEKWGNPTPA